MNIRAEFIVTKVNHYDMGDSRGLSVRIQGNFEDNSNSFGISFNEAVVPDYNELSYLKRFKNDLPAKFKADFGMVTKKLANGKEVPTVALSNLEFVNSVEFVDKKTVSTK